MAKMFTTPADVPEGLACRTLKIPNNGIWLGIFNQVLLETLNPYNWEQTYPEDMTIEDTIAVCQEIINLYWIAENCPDGDNCLQPDGYRVLRLNLNGFIEQLSAGAWAAPTDDYEVPPTPARDEPTATERKCAAAANAQNVLEQTYEQVTDAIAEGLTVAELAVIMATELTLLLGPAFGFIVPAFIFLLEAAALAFIEIAEFMATDVWDAEFSDLLTCALLDCASDDADVVTFDYQCVIDNLAKNVDLLNPLAQSQLLLFGQVNFMLSIIGIDGLNAAGATTEITDADCDYCGGDCYEFKFNEVTGEFEAELLGGLEYASWSTSSGWQHYSATTDYRGRSCYILRDFSDFTDIESIEIFIGGANHHDVWWSFTGGVDATGYPNHETNGDSSYLITGVGTVSFFAWAMARSGVGTMTSTVERIKVTGTGNFPTPFVPCEE